MTGQVDVPSAPVWAGYIEVYRAGEHFPQPLSTAGEPVGAFIPALAVLSGGTRFDLEVHGPLNDVAQELADEVALNLGLGFRKNGASAKQRECLNSAFDTRQSECFSLQDAIRKLTDTRLLPLRSFAIVPRFAPNAARREIETVLGGVFLLGTTPGVDSLRGTSGATTHDNAVDRIKWSSKFIGIQSKA